jgi:pimeloyl-ACP methyl ester carboxylesterase
MIQFTSFWFVLTSGLMLTPDVEAQRAPETISADGLEAMQTIASRDGTLIAYWVWGTGPSLVLVHGASSDHTRFAPALKALSEHFTVYAMDRRGRGSSLDSQDYALAREYEDILAVVDVAPDPVFLLGHSYGGICALEAALRTSRVRKLILYEPPVAAPQNDSISDYEALLAEGRNEEMLERFLRENARLPESEIEMLRRLPTWSSRVAAARTIPRELRVVQSYELDMQRLATLEIPTLLLVGGDSPQFQQDGAEQLHKAIPGSRVVALPGQQHSAMMTAPGLFVEEVRSFLEE